jgi:hypothetical protein
MAGMAKAHFHVLNAGGQFSGKDMLAIKSAAREALGDIHSALPKIDVDVVFMHAPAATIPGEFIGGRSTSASNIFIYFDATYPRLDQVIQKKMKAIIAHEYHHACRWRSVGYGDTLGEAIVTEGLADNFSLEIYKSKPPIWCRSLSPKQATQWMKKASVEFDNANYDHISWFFGSQTVPRWAAYTLGFSLVKKYLAAHHVRASACVDLRADKILALAK